MASFVNTLTLTSKDFPEELKHVKPAVKQLYWFGRDPRLWLSQPRVAIVGSRLVSPYGRSVTENLAAQLSRAGVAIISGLALGTDAVAHQAAVKAGGTAVAVMPGGLDKIYPASHRNLAIQIVRSRGCLVSEYPEGTTVHKFNFVARNRIVSALADVLLITEAGLKSGTIHTARFALEQGKTVMAVPGNISSPTSQGCNNLIKSGAIPVTEPGDVFFALGINPGAAAGSPAFADKQEKAVFEIIAGGISDQELLATMSRLDAAKLSGILTMLEINGHIRAGGNGHWFPA